MPDEIARALTGDGYVRVMAVTAREMTERARQIHHTSPAATAALGRTLAAASMMGNMLKEVKGSVTLQIKGGGPLGTIMAVADHEGNVRGYVQNPEADLPLRADGKLDVGGVVGSGGYLTVSKDLGLKEPYSGSVRLISGEIAEDVAAYFVESEQVPTACGLGVLVDVDRSVLAAGGFLIQLMPGADEALIGRIEEGIRAAGPVTEILRRGEGALGLLKRALPFFKLTALETGPVEYRCYCSRERVSRALISLGRRELEQMIREQDGAELTCQFCDRVYRFSAGELKELLASL